MKYFSLLLLLIIGFGILIRVFQFGSVPNGLNQDETAIGYNAYSILKTGKDEHGVSYPLYFKSFNDYKLPVYIYATTIPISILGPTPIAVRMLSLLSGIAALALIYLISKQLFSRNIALAAAFLLAINPWHIFFSRASLEVNVATTFILLGVYFFLSAISAKKYWLFYFSIISFGLSLYTYNVTRLVAPAILLLMVFIYRKNIRQVPSSLFYSALGLFVIVTFPFVWTFLFSASGFGNQASQLLISGNSKAEMLELRSYMLSLPIGLSGMLFNQYIQIPYEYLKNLIDFFSVDFFFLAGDTNGNFGISNYGMFHIFEAITILFGTVVLIRKKSKEAMFVLGWVLLIILIVSMSTITPHPTRAYPMVIPLTIISAVGFVYIVSWVKRQKSTIRIALYIVGACIISYSIIYFLTSYFVRFPVYYADKWRSEEEKLIGYIEKNQADYESILIDPSINLAYTSLLFYSAYAPFEYHKDSTYVQDGQLIRLEKAGKYETRSIDWESDTKQSTLIVSRSENAPEIFSPEKIFYLPERPVVLFYDNKIAQYPTQDEAFAIFTFNKK